MEIFVRADDIHCFLVAISNYILIVADWLHLRHRRGIAFCFLDRSGEALIPDQLCLSDSI